MPEYKNWTVEVRNEIELHLFIDGKDVGESISGTSKQQESQASQVSRLQEKEFIVRHITAVKEVVDDPRYIQICIGKFGIKLLSEKFVETSLFSSAITSTEHVLKYWHEIGGFLSHNDKEEKKNDDGKSSEEKDMDEDQEKRDISKEINDCLYVRKDNDKNQHDEEEIISSHLLESQESNESENSSRSDLSDCRNNLLKSIQKKKVAYKYLDIFTLSDPPPKFRVREVDEEFVDTVASTMVAKNSISVDNAPNVIGLIDMDKTRYEEDNFSEYEIYILDGNHSIRAQKIAYKRTNDPIFKYRGVNIYCGLSEEEALLLGISRNEDTGQFVKFSDYQKVVVLRRRLYAMTDTPLSSDPPTPPKSFKDVFARLLNLQSKQAIDSKNILRFLSTNLSNRCYNLYKDICTRGKYNVPASKFEGLKGLSEMNSFASLLALSETKLGREDWHLFNKTCQEKQLKPKKFRKDVTVTFQFHHDSTQAHVGHKQMNGNLVCYRFLMDGEEVVLTDATLRKLIFYFQPQDYEMLDTSRKDSVMKASSSQASMCVPVDSSSNLQNTLLSADISTFLYEMADHDAARRAESRQVPIEEEEVTVVPETLLNHVSVLLNPTVQTKAKQFFSEDAWKTAENTLKILEERHVQITQRELDLNSECTSKGKGKSLIGPQKGRIFSRRRSEAKEKVKLYIDKSLKELASTPKKESIQKRRNMYSFCGEDYSPIKVSIAKKTRLEEDKTQEQNKQTGCVSHKIESNNGYNTKENHHTRKEMFPFKAGTQKTDKEKEDIKNDGKGSKEVKTCKAMRVSGYIDDVVCRTVMKSIQKKKVAYKYLDIFTLSDPPPKFRVREVDEEFVDTVASTMVAKNSISVDNAPNVIASTVSQDSYETKNNLGLSDSSRNNLMKSIQKKKVAYKYLDIFTLSDPPPKFLVREVDEECVDTVASTMVAKNSISVDNAPNVIGLIDMDKSCYEEDNFSEYEIYILDGNHSIKAQKDSYKRTNRTMYP